MRFEASRWACAPVFVAAMALLAGPVAAQSPAAPAKPAPTAAMRQSLPPKRAPARGEALR